MISKKSKVIHLTSKLPAFKSDLSDVRKRSLFLEHISLSEIPIKLVLLTYYFFKSIFGNLIYKPKFFSFITSPILSLVTMHKLSKSLPADKSLNIKIDPCNFEDSKIFDEIVIGSGPGGSISALNSIKNGKNTLIVEKGGDQNISVQHHSLEQLVYFFNRGGQELIYSQKPILVAQGKVWGGGSEINSGLYHRLPLHIRHKWLHLLNISESEWLSSELEVEKNLHINSQKVSSEFISRSVISKISKYLDLPSHLIPRWRIYEDASFTHYGMANTYLKDFISNGGNYILNHEVTKIHIQDNEKLELTVVGISCSHKIFCSHLTLSGGTIETPRLLKKSRLINHKKLNFQFHLMSRIVALFDYDVNDLKDIDPYQVWDADQTYKFGASVSTEDLLNGILSNESMNVNADFNKIGSYYASIIPEGKSGFFKIGKSLYPYYLLNKKTKSYMLSKLEILRDALLGVGATRIFYDLNNTNYSTVHIFGSLPVGGSELVDNFGRLKGYENWIRISDASVLPTPPFVNPQGPMMVLLNILSNRFEKLHD